MKRKHRAKKMQIELSPRAAQKLATVVMGFEQIDYEELAEVLDSANIPDKIKATLSVMVEDHKRALDSREEIIEESRKAEEEVFGLRSDGCSQAEEQASEKQQGSALENPVENCGTLSSQDYENQQENNGESQQSSPSDKSTYDNADELKKDADKESKSQTHFSRAGQRRLPRSKIINHHLSDDEKKCTFCGKQMTSDKPREKTFVFALRLLSTETHVSQACRCLNCGTSLVAKGGEEVQEKSIGRFHFSAVSALAALRYQYGMASYRMEDLSAQLGIEVSDSTQWLLFESAANIVKPFVTFLEREIANAPVQYCDDTHNFLLEIAREIRRKQEEAVLKGDDPSQIRTGIHTTNITGEFPEGSIVVYKTGLHHLGEILGKLLGNRTTQEQVIIMSDASSCTTSKLDLGRSPHIKIAHCNSHAIRKFKELSEKAEQISKEFGVKENKMTQEVDYFLARYRKVFKYDSDCKKFTRKERLDYHRQNSLPLMEEMRAKAQKMFDDKIVEPNSDFGKACKYFSNHFEKLAAFCFEERAPVSNNLCEQMLKCIIRHRKNSLFFRTQVGATVGDLLTSILFTAKANNIDSIQYLHDLLAYKEEWSQNPRDWLPWNYTDTMNKLRPKPPSQTERSYQNPSRFEFEAHPAF